MDSGFRRNDKTSMTATNFFQSDERHALRALALGRHQNGFRFSPE
jgi:hypothetical protein